MVALAVSRLTITERWWLLALRGLCAILFGAFALLAPGVTLLVLTVWFAAFMAVDGALALVAGFGALAQHRHGAAFVVEGVLGLLVAATLLAWPAAGVAAVVYLAAAWAILTGVALLWAALLLPLPGGKLLLGAAALLSVALGVFLIAHPLAGAFALAIWIGAYAVASGIFMVGAAVHLRAVRGTAA